MSSINKTGTTLALIIMVLGNTVLFSQTFSTDTLSKFITPEEKYELFYDSLKIKANKKRFTKWLHSTLINEPSIKIDNEAISLNYFYLYRNKTIRKIEIKALEVFGPSFADTSKKATSKIEKLANTLHTKTNLRIIEKNLIIKPGGKLDPEILYENERILRQLSFIKDAKIILNSDSLNSEFVDVLVLTKDVFSLGASGSANGLKSAALQVYNRNIFGAGHEISTRFVGNLNREPYLGAQVFYKINNIKAKFINLEVGFSHYYRENGASFSLKKEFLIPSTKSAFGLTFKRYSKTLRITEFDPVELAEPFLNLSLIDGWYGKSIQINPFGFFNSQLSLSGRVTKLKFFDRPQPDDFNNQYFSNSTFYLTGITWSQRRYLRDQLVYSYGITEDIPLGFKNEFVLGFNYNEFGNKWYSHLSVSNGNGLARYPGFLYMSAAISGYFKKNYYEQGLIQAKINYISRLITYKNSNLRFFSRLNYMIGIRRFGLETLLLRTDDHIRGFSSRHPQGKQRLSFNFELTKFLNNEIYKFNVALFSFVDLGIIGSNKKLIFNESYYGGLGLGIRLHNEFLVLNTIQLRLAFYPNAPEGMGFAGFLIEEQTKNNFYSFQPGPPEPIIFQ